MSFGFPEALAGDIALTALWLNAPEIFFDQLGDLPELKGARVLRHDLTSESWQSRIAGLAGRMTEISGGPGWVMPVALTLTVDDEGVFFDEPDWPVFVLEDDAVRAPEDADFAVMDQVHADCGLLPRDVLANGILQAWGVLPRDIARATARLDGSGLCIRLFPGGPTPPVDMVLATT